MRVRHAGHVQKPTKLSRDRPQYMSGSGLLLQHVTYQAPSGKKHVKLAIHPGTFSKCSTATIT